MRRGLLLLNLLLAVAAGLAGWQMYRQYHATLARQRQYLSRQIAPPAPPILALPGDPPPVQATNYLEIAARLPFSPDRNPTVVIEVVAPKPMPALPGYHGMMNLGHGPRVILSGKGLPQRGYSVGESIGEFKLVAVAQSGLVFEWDGKQVPASYAELMRLAAEAPPPQAQAAPVAMAAAPSSSSSSVTAVGRSSAPAATVSTSSGGVMGEAVDSVGMRDCKAGDSTPEGTIVDGYRKLTTRSPFGVICRWVPVK